MNSQLSLVQYLNISFCAAMSELTDNQYITSLITCYQISPSHVLPYKSPFSPKLFHSQVNFMLQLRWRNF